MTTTGRPTRIVPPAQLPPLDVLTSQQLEEMPTKVLRQLAERDLPDYSRLSTVITIELTTEVIEHRGAMEAIDRFLKVAETAYIGREPKLRYRYNNVEVAVWRSDSELRAALSYQAERERKEL
jgi:hypothetical protein